MEYVLWHEGDGGPLLVASHSVSTSELSTDYSLGLCFVLFGDFVKRNFFESIIGCDAIRSDSPGIARGMSSMSPDWRLIQPLGRARG
jgi:hypothetical protein